MRARDIFARANVSPSFATLAVLLCVLTVAGGASRADVLGQVIVRVAAFTALAVALIFVKRAPERDVAPVIAILLAALAITLMQLVPLPPGVWTTLPGREVVEEAARIAGEAQPWRPLALVPGATINAASSLVVPLAVCLLAIQLHPAEHHRLLPLLLGLIAFSGTVGLLQVSGGGFNNPIVNDSPGDVGGLFANRNHFALFMAMGLVIAPSWTVRSQSLGHTRAVVGFSLIIMFVLIILASGSRAGILLGMLGLSVGLLMARREIRRLLRPYPRWALPALLGALVAIVGLFVAASVSADRAVSITRALELQTDNDIRTLALPTVLDMISAYFPAGSGFGGFDQVFRIHEPFELLKPTYFNHAHNDFLEIVLDGGLAGLLVLAGALGWWVWASVRAWRAAESRSLEKLGSAIILLVLVASVVDYPARTPLIMAMLVIAGIWMARRPEPSSRAALRSPGKHL